jgi:hypothetical protein
LTILQISFIIENKAIPWEEDPMKRVALALASLAWAHIASAGVVFVNLGTGSPPAQLGGRPTIPFATGPQAAIADGEFVGEIPGSPVGALQISPSLRKATVPGTWGSWSHGYGGPVFTTDGADSVTFFLPANALGFYFYAQPAALGSYGLTATSDNGTSSGPIMVSGNHGARGFGFYGTEGTRISSITVEADAASGGLAVGEFGVISAQAGCAVMEIELGDTVDDTWSSNCASTNMSGSYAKFYAFELTAPGGVQIDLQTSIADAFLFLLEGRGLFGPVIASNDDGGEGLNSRITIPLDPGEYTIEATTLSDQAEGPFTLRLARAGSCNSDLTTLCIEHPSAGSRFQARVHFETTQGGGAAGDAEVIPLADLGVAQGGIFWFFRRDNPEMLLKVLDGCAVNGHFWVFYSAATNVGFVATVVDTLAGETQTYINPDRTPALPLLDTLAFECQ